jgi:putative ABC transport system permease protein
MKLLESLRIALRSIGANKMRSALTMLGMIIGVGAVIALMSIGQGAQAQISSQIRGFGTNLLFISPGAQQQGGVRQAAGSQPTLTYEDAIALSDPDVFPEIALVAPEQAQPFQVIAGGQNTNTRVTGTTPEYQEVRNFHVAVGDFIESSQIDAASNVAVLGSSTAKTLFHDGDPIGQTIAVATNQQGAGGAGQRRVNLRVIGIMETKGSGSFGSQDEVVLVPLTTFQKKISRERTSRGAQNVSQIYVSLIDETKPTRDAAVDGIGQALRERHRANQDDFTIRSQEDLLQAANQVTGIFTVFLGGVAGISLVVGGIGIMNIMIVSVTERTREIGIRKAVGAKRRDILLQFLVESLAVSIIGGGVGIAIGMGLSYLFSQVQFSGQSLPAVVTADSVILAFGVSAAIGLFFGIYPAVRAARLNPIDALRYE